MEVTCVFLDTLTEQQRELAQLLGYSAFLSHGKDFEYIKEKTTKVLLKKIDRARSAQRKSIVEVADEKQLRFVLERTKATCVMGLEWIHPSDSLHYARTGFDQIIAQLAVRKNVTIAIDLSRIINCTSLRKQAQILGRVRLLCNLARKKGVSVFFCTLASKKSDLRSASDLKAVALSLSETRGSILQF